MDSFGYRFWKMTAAATMTFLLVLLVLFCPNKAAKTGTCEYDLDMPSQKVKIICQGSSSMVNVYVNNALMQVNEYENVNNFRENTYDEHVPTVTRQHPYSSSGNSNSETRQSVTVKKRPGDSGQQREASERMRFPEESFAPQSDGEDIVSVYDGWFAGLISEVGERLQKAKQNLSYCGDSIKNVSNQLSQGDSNLRPDLENLRKGDNSVTDLTEGIIKALRNQYNFMSNAFLSRNYEIQKLASALAMLVDLTSDGLNTTVETYRMVTEEVSMLDAYLAKLRRRVSKSISRHDRFRRQEVNGRPDKCPKEISAFGLGTMTKVQWETGSYMVEPANQSHRRSVFIMAETGPANQLREYNTALEVEYDLVGRYLTLPFSCSGTGHVVYRRNFYCHRADSNLIVKYNLNRTELVSELALPGAKYGNSLPYKSGANTDIDLSVDELGLWAVYATDASAGNMVISKIDQRKMNITGTWITTYPKQRVGNAFMICGTLYAMNSHSDTPTYISYTYDTKTNQEKVWEEGALPFANSAFLGMRDKSFLTDEEKSTNSVMLSYDFRQSSLYSWNKRRVEVFPVYFKQ